MIKAEDGEVTFRGIKKPCYGRGGYCFTCA